MSFADIRTLEHVPGKSINLAMSIRGLSALNSIGLGNHVAEEYGIPMRARMIHRLDGTTYPVPYGKKGQAIYSVGRRYVNEILLNGKHFLLFRFLKSIPNNLESNMSLLQNICRNLTSKM